MNMYEGVKTINFLNGECSHRCIYCSSKSLRENVKPYYMGELRLNENAFKKNLGKGNTWFVCAQNDLFADEVPNNFILRIYDHIAMYPDNNYWFQSKNPQRMFESARNPFVYGTTIETNRDNQIYNNVPTQYERYYWIKKIKEDFGVKTFITIEPILDFDLDALLYLVRNANVDCVNIGADSKKHDLKEPPKDKILSLIKELEKITEVRLKTNLQRLIK